MFDIDSKLIANFTVLVFENFLIPYNKQTLTDNIRFNI